MKAKFVQNLDEYTIYKNTVDPINFLRTLGTLMVFGLHTYVFSSQRGFCYDNRTWFLQTPAWGGVWIFLFISGYLSGKGFYMKKYQMNFKGICSYYWGRFFKVALPTLIYIYMCCVLIQPDFIKNNPIFISKILTLSYDGNPSFDAIGGTWYVSTLMGLYLVAPFLFLCLQFLADKIKEYKYKNLLWIILLIIIASLGLIARLYLLNQGVDWSSRVYVPFYMNLDIFICGMLLNFLCDTVSNKLNNIPNKIFCVILILCFVIFNTYIYYIGKIIFYQYILPSFYIIFFSIYMLVFEKNPQKCTPLTFQTLRRNPLRIIDWFSSLSFGFYLFHSLILNRIYTLVEGASPLRIHLKLLFYGFILTIPFSYLIRLIVNECAIVSKKFFSS